MRREAWAPIIAVAIIWAAVILAVSSALEGLAVQRHGLSLRGGWLRRRA